MAEKLDDFLFGIFLKYISLLYKSTDKLFKETENYSFFMLEINKNVIFFSMQLLDFFFQKEISI